jgi:hypothetical protein
LAGPVDSVGHRVVPIEGVQTTMEEPDTMADELRMALREGLRKVEAEHGSDFLREGMRVLAQALMEAEVAQHVGAERYERTSERRGERNGYRERAWDTRAGTLELRVPRVRDGSYFPALLEPRRRAGTQTIRGSGQCRFISRQQVEGFARPRRSS